MTRSPEPTPMMRQYQAIKAEVPDALLFFRLGDFYELFFDDAVTASEALDITLTARQKERGQPIPMCGVPYHAADGYVARLLARGHKVAICDQTEPPRKGVKLVARQITRIVTPGTVTDPDLLREGENNYLLGVVEKDGVLGSAFLDLSTGQFMASQSDAPDRWEDLRLRIAHMRPKEILFPRSDADSMPEVPDCVSTPQDDWVFDPDTATRTLLDQFRTRTLEGFGCADQRLAVSAAGALVHYARQTQKTRLEHISGLRCDLERSSLHLDPASIRNLELVEAAASGATGAPRTLLAVMDRTRTPMGARLLRAWLLRPAIELEEITARHDAVQDLTSSAERLDGLRTAIAPIRDIERLLGKVTVRTATPREVVSLRASLRCLPTLADAMSPLVASRFRHLAGRLDPLPDLTAKLDAALVDEPPVALSDGGIIRPGFHDELDSLRTLSSKSKTFLAELEGRERERTGITSLKVRYNRVFGYYLEISRANLHRVPADYVRKQTLVGAERFITEELKTYEEKILNAEERIVALEKELFEVVSTDVAESAARIRQTASVVAETDVISTFAECALRFGYTRPEIVNDDSLVIRNGRHPVLEALAMEHEAERFVPNDLAMDRSTSRIHIVTGPNMGGKSTYLRQNALIVIMAHMGAYVPAGFARIPITDRVFTRIGASDDLARGRSTFMVEMTETAIILNSATARSLIVLDEVGRGTATYDGLSIAWAVVEFIGRRIGARTLFATHYHELTALEEQLPGVRNFHVTVRESGEDIVFLRKVAPGAADRSYGIEVARLAGIPGVVVRRAREILKKHERSGAELSDNHTPRTSHEHADEQDQLALFSPAEEELRLELERIDIDRTSPLEALKLLAELKEKARRS
jgi:DNA mismatch repair protein MutS